MTVVADVAEVMETRRGAATTETRREAAAWAVLDTVPDPEVPALSLRDLGVVREVREIQGHDAGASNALEVVLTPTYSGCPATEVIAESVKTALEAQGLGPIVVTQRLAPAWTTDWISEAGREKLRAYGIAPPPHSSSLKARPAPACPRCGSSNTEEISRFGSTPCKALWRCLSCAEPFDHFKCH